MANGTIHSYCAVVGVDVRHFKPQISPTQTCSQADVDAEVAECEVLLMKSRIFLWCATVSTSISLLVAVVGYLMSHSQ